MSGVTEVSKGGRQKDSRSSGRGVNMGPPDCEAGVLYTPF
jgi:hypothetical protein